MPPGVGQCYFEPEGAQGNIVHPMHMGTKAFFLPCCSPLALTGLWLTRAMNKKVGCGFGVHPRASICTKGLSG